MALQFSRTELSVICICPRMGKYKFTAPHSAPNLLVKWPQHHPVDWKWRSIHLMWTSCWPLCSFFGDGRHRKVLTWCALVHFCPWRSILFPTAPSFCWGRRSWHTCDLHVWPWPHTTGHLSQTENRATGMRKICTSLVYTCGLDLMPQGESDRKRRLAWERSGHLWSTCVALTSHHGMSVPDRKQGD